MIFAAACVLSAIGALVFNAFPLFLSVTADQFALNDAQLGLLGTSYLGGFAVIALLAPLWMSKLEWRLSGAAGSVLMLSALVLLGLTSIVDSVYIAMGALGAGAGIVFTIGLTILSRAADPERAFGIKLMYEMTFAGILIFVMTKFVIVRFGFTGFVVGSFLLYLVSTLFVLKLPANFLRRELTVPAKLALSHQPKLPTCLAVFALLIQFAAFSAVWAFMERIGLDNGLDSGFIGTVLTVSIVAGLAGAGLAAILGNGYGHIAPLVAGLLATIASVIVLASLTGATAYVLAASGINATLQFTIAYQMGLIAHTDYSGRIAIMIPFFLAVSGGIGPGIAGAVIETSGFAPVYWGFAIITVVTILTSIWVGRHEPQAADR